MVYYLATEHAFYTLLKFLESDQGGLGRRMIPVSYRHLLNLKEPPEGTYIFSDLDRLTAEEVGQVAAVWNRLSRNRSNRLLNHPTRSLQRYELLRGLHKQGWNQFNVYKPTECRRPDAFPVFVRFTNRHNGAITPLLFSQSELDHCLASLLESGQGLEDKLVIEFCDTVDQSGIFRKYSTYLIGEQLIPSALLFRADWHVKSNSKLLDEQMHPERVAYLQSSAPEEVRQIFRFAKIDYGRVDYSVLNGQIQTWEINTNPDISGLSGRKLPPWNVVEGLPMTEYLRRKFLAAFEALDGPQSATDSGLRLWHLSKPEEILRAFEDCVPPGKRVLWVDGPETCGLGNHVTGRELTPFPAQDDFSAGVPTDDDVAIHELERLRKAGLEFIVFTWPSFWWFEYYPRFFQYLRSNFSAPAQDELIAIFDLGSKNHT